MKSRLLFTAVSCFLSLAVANTPIPQSTLDTQGVYPFVVASRPKWWFGIPSKALCPSRTAPCYPEYAVNHTTGAQNPGQNLCDWPNANCGCQYPSENGQAGGIKARAFPHYWIASQCSNTEVRAGFWVYYPKDGFVGSGHRHDWEYYIVVWSKQADGNYIRSSHVFSYHGDRLQENWNVAANVEYGLLSPCLENTSAYMKISDNLNSVADGQGNHALVYPGWSKHPNFPDKNTHFCDTLSQSTKNAYRSDDWWYYADESDLFQADASTQIGGWIDSIGANWGSANSYPSSAGGEGRICALNGTGGVILRVADRESKMAAVDTITLADLGLEMVPMSGLRKRRVDTETC
ncbi:hypothetical protein BT69DRAFT_1353429 [Atractiella rhizophila]|nr:hypothetical protein BT69DRAFT_1353429 [Atractiella rhizophila]